MRNSQLGRASLFITALVFTTAAAFAGTINYGSFDDLANGGTVLYTDVTEMSVTHDPPLYGAPSVSMNTLDFDPLGFGASSSGGSAPELLDGRLEFGVEALDGHFIPEVAISERGDFTLIGTGSELTFVQAYTPVTVKVHAIDGNPVSGVSFSDFMSFVPPDGTYNLVDDGGIGVVWEGTVAFDLNQRLLDEGISFNLGATSIGVELNNIMAAQSEAGSIATIAKKDFQAFSVSIVPEPSTIGLVLLGLVAAAHARRRR